LLIPKKYSQNEMNLNILRLIVAALCCTSALMVIANVRAQKSLPVRSDFTVSLTSLGIVTPAQTPAATATTQEKTVEQTHKNIQVLTGLPDSQLIPVMNFFAASLGRRCNFCHVNKNGQWDYPADDKPEKSRAREMIKMVLDVNKTTFQGNLEVSCYTCHRGRNQPLSLPPLPLPLPSPPPRNPGGPGPGGAATPGGAPAQASPSPSPALPSVDDILNKYVAAIGGQAAIDKLKTRVMKGTYAGANGAEMPYEVIRSAPDKGYGALTTPNGIIEQGFDGNAGWQKNQQGLREITGQALADLKISSQFFRDLKLKEQYSRMRVSGKDKIGDREVYVIGATLPDKRGERLFFDAETGLLLRRIGYTRTMIGIIPEQTDFEDYREVEGVKFPFTVRVSSVDAGNPVSTRKYTEIKLNVPVDDSKFKMPPAPTKPTP